MIDNELKEIIVKAIPAEDCPVKNAYAMHRRELLEVRLIEYISTKLQDGAGTKHIV